MLVVSRDNFEDEVINSSIPVLVDFNASWCGPCRMMSPILDEISNERSSVKVVSINVDDEEELAQKYNVSSIPCLVLFKDGSEVDRSVGLKPKEDIERFIGV